jgi:hypothetical protein
MLRQRTLRNATLVVALLVSNVSSCSPAPPITQPAAPVVAIPLADVTTPPAEQAPSPVAEESATIITGTVRFRGSVPAPVPVAPECRAFSRAAQVVRIGTDDEVADVLVAVTEWSGEPPTARGPFVVELADCEATPRNVALAPDQRLQIVNGDTRAYDLVLDGVSRFALAPGASHELSLPSGTLHRLRADHHPQLEVPVFALLYATHAITDHRGRYRIEGVPPGRAKLSAHLPAVNAVVNRTIEVQLGHNEIDLVLP